MNLIFYAMFSTSHVITLIPKYIKAGYCKYDNNYIPKHNDLAFYIILVLF